jgi:cysteine desulfurase
VRVYLDHQAATPVLPEVLEAMLPFQSEAFGNCSSLHAEGVAARAAVNKAREQLAEFIGASSPEEILFTGNGTEAVNLAVKGAAFANQRRGKHIVMTAAEHPAVTSSCAWLADFGFSTTSVPVDSEGRVEPGLIARAMRADTILVCVHHANHDIGTVQELDQIGGITSERGIPLFVDAVASAGWLPINVDKIRSDLLAFSPHRFYGPKGVGVLYRHRRARIVSLIHGGDQESGKRAGTENVPAIVGAGLAAEIAGHEAGSRAEHTRALQKKAFADIYPSVPHLKLNGPPPGPHRHPANLNVSVEFAEGEGLALMLDVKGFAIAAGAACVTKSMRVPPVLAAIGLPESLAKGNVIISFGRDNTEEEVDRFVEAFSKAVEKLREMSPLWDDFQRGIIKSEITAAQNMTAV